MDGPSCAVAGSGGALVVLSATVTVVASKSVGFFDLEPDLGLLTAVAYLWIGTILLREE